MREDLSLTTVLRSSGRAMKDKRSGGDNGRQQSRKRRAKFAHRGDRHTDRRRDPGTVSMTEAEPIVLSQRPLALPY